jgi:hypothetical protein
MIDPTPTRVSRFETADAAPARSVSPARPGPLTRTLGVASVPWLAALASLGLLASSLSVGLATDDHYHRLVLTGSRSLAPVSSDPFDMFAWAKGDPEQARAALEVGLVGWWFDPEVVMAYFRPLTVWTHLVDYRLWPDRPWLMHLHSLLWFAVGLTLVQRTYARLLRSDADAVGATALCSVAFALFALDEAHALTVAWIANRNALCAFAFGCAALLLHDRGVRDGDRLSTWTAPLCLGLALLAGETGLAAAGYLLAYALFLDARPRARALGDLLPAGGALALWALAHRALGYGVRGSDVVIDPVSDPLGYLAAASERVPVLLTAQLALPPSDLWEGARSLTGGPLPTLPLWTGLVLAGCAAAFWPLLRARADARFCAAGMLLATLPVAAQVPSDRLLLFTGLGAMPLIALVIARGATAGAPRRARALALAFVIVHLLFAPASVVWSVQTTQLGERILGQADAAIGEDVALSAQTLVLLNAPFEGYVGYLQLKRAAEGRPLPRALRLLATGSTALEVRRSDLHTLEIAALDGFLALPADRMLRSLARPLPVGYRVAFSDSAVEILELLADGRPARIRVRFERPLEDPALRFLYWREGEVAPFPLPAVGDTTRIARVDYVALLAAAEPGRR